nr:hypothetical protein Iba_chr14cCG4650 [Ipomoea batatas]
MESWSPNGATATEKEMDGERGCELETAMVGLVGWILEVADLESVTLCLESADGNGEHLRSPVGMEVAGGYGGRHFKICCLCTISPAPFPMAAKAGDALLLEPSTPEKGFGVLFSGAGGCLRKYQNYGVEQGVSSTQPGEGLASVAEANSPKSARLSRHALVEAGRAGWCSGGDLLHLAAETGR